MRALITALLLALALPVCAEGAKPLPKDLQPVPEPPPPTCVSCPTGYHCAHNPERCVPD